MKSLSFRVSIALLAVAVISISLLDVAFLFHSAGAATSERRLAMRAALAEVRAAGARAAGALADIAATYELTLTLTGAGVPPRSTGTAAFELPRAGEHRVDGAFEHEAAALAGAAPYDTVVATRRRDEGLRRAFAWQAPAAAIFAAVAAIIVLLGSWFLRRAVVSPLVRLTELLRGDDRDALSRFTSETTDLVSRLSRAIITQNQRIADDKAQIEQQLRALTESNRQLEATHHQLLRAERLAVVGQLAAGLAHEVGNPLAVLSGFVELLRDPALPEADRAQALSRMSKELDRIHATVRHLLDFSRAPASGEPEGDVCEALQHVRQLLAPQERFRKVQVEWPEPTEPVVVPLAADALTQVLVNLLFNAADAMGGEGRVRVGLMQEDGKVRLEVADSGPGIPAAVLPRIFEPFFTTKPAGSGTGLGLAVCERIIAAAGGDIEAGRGPLGGAALRVTLPARAGRAR